MKKVGRKTYRRWARENHQMILGLLKKALDMPKDSSAQDVTRRLEGDRRFAKELALQTVSLVGQLARAAESGSKMIGHDLKEPRLVAGLIRGIDSLSRHQRHPRA